MSVQVPLWLGFAVGALVVVLAGVVLGLLVGRRLRTRRLVDPVAGSLQVVGANTPGPQAAYSNYRLHGVVSAPGIPATPVELRGIARVSKWPMPGKTLPVLVDRQDPTRLQIQWRQVSTGTQNAAAQADRLAQAMRAEGGGSEWTQTVPGQLSGGQADAVAAAVKESLAKVGLSADSVNVRAVQGLSATGEPAAAVVTGCRDVHPPPGQAPPGGAVELTLAVTRADGSTHAARVGAMFSSTERRARYGTVGARLPVRVDPADPSRVTIDYAALAGGV